MIEMYSVWCEWDIGQDKLLFHSPEAAMNWAKDNDNLKEMGSFEDLADDGLVGWEKYEVYDD